MVNWLIIQVIYFAYTPSKTRLGPWLLGLVSLHPSNSRWKLEENLLLESEFRKMLERRPEKDDHKWPTCKENGTCKMNVQIADNESK